MTKALTLTGKQQAFVQYYVANGFNAKEAAIAAGYSEKSADSFSSQVLNNPKVKKAIADLVEGELYRRGVSKERVIAEIARIAFSDIRQVLTWDDKGIKLKDSKSIKRDTAAAIQSVKEKVSIDKEDGSVLHINREIKMYDKKSALDTLAKHLGLLEDEKFNGGKPIEVNLNYDPKK